MEMLLNIFVILKKFLFIGIGIILEEMDFFKGIIFI